MKRIKLVFAVVAAMTTVLSLGIVPWVPYVAYEYRGAYSL